MGEQGGGTDDNSDGLKYTCGGVANGSSRGVIVIDHQRTTASVAQALASTPASATSNRPRETTVNE